MRKSTTGFTIVELLVVIAVIGILTTITLIGFTRYQMSNRDTERETKTTVLAEALEKYYDNNGEYPGCVAVNGADTTIISKDVLLGVESKTYLTPKSTSTETNSIECVNITGAAGEADVFAYVGDGTAACNTGAACLGWTLKYKEESTNTIKTISSRRSTSIATSGTGTMAASPVNFTQINTSWSPVNNALSYEVQWATNNTFTAGVSTLRSATLSRTYSATGLAYDTQYYFRVRAVAAVSVGEWSTVVGGHTWGLTTPTINAVIDPANTSTKFITSWPAVSHAASYNVQCSGNGTTWSGCTGSTAGLSFSWGPTSQGTILYFRTQAVNGSYVSAWSPTDNATTTIDAPSAFVLNSSNTLPNWNYLNVASAATCPAGTSLYSHWYANGGYWTDGGPQSYGLSWNTSVTMAVASRCTKGSVISGWVWANNTASMSLPWPSVSTWLPGDSIMYWSGTCPKWTTNYNYHYVTNGRVGAVGDTQGGSYGPPGTWWGNGNAHITLACAGPWGTASIENTSSYGSGCVPNKTLAECSY